MSAADAPDWAREMMMTARASAKRWRQVPLAERGDLLADLRRHIVRSRCDIIAQICAETNKSRAEALISDILPTLEILHYTERNFAHILSPDHRTTPLLYRDCQSRVEYRPRGVVLVISPWNNPFQLSVVPVISALAAGNAVVLKPSERTPKTGALAGQLCHEAGIPGDLLQVASGGGEAGERLVASGPDMIFFTGGVKNGRSVLQAAAENFIPVILELGGKDPMIVFSDVNLPRALNALTYGAFAHSGQHCISTKRLYVQATIYESFLQQLKSKIRDVPEANHGCGVADENVLAKARSQVQEALEAGARLILPGDPAKAATEPTLLADVDHTMRIMKEETFAPVVAAQSFRDKEEALRLANDCPFGLNASVWSEDLEMCETLIERLETGNVFVNNVFTNVGNPHLPFGGVKNSGLGRYHGPEGLRSFCRTHSVMISDNRKQKEPNWFPHTQERMSDIEELIELRHGERGLLQRLSGWIKLLWRMR
jgi:acyl-CoA reductase-like NAD-dependent aldehyde dehydrogenase